MTVKNQTVSPRIERQTGTRSHLGRPELKIDCRDTDTVTELVDDSAAEDAKDVMVEAVL